MANELPAEKYDVAFAAVAHKKLDGLDVPALLKEKRVIFDVKFTLIEVLLTEDYSMEFW